MSSSLTQPKAASIGTSYDMLSPDDARVFTTLIAFRGSWEALAEEVVLADQSHESLSRLVRLSLVLYNRAKDRYALHNLVRLFAESKSDRNRTERARLKHAQYYRLAKFCVIREDLVA